MGMSAATLEMRTPEAIRERLHELVKSTRTVIVLSCTLEPSNDDGEHDLVDGRPMALVRTGDDTTMYLAASFDAKQAEELARAPRVTVVVQGADYAVFSGEARLSRDRRLINELWTDAWMQWFRGKWDSSIAVVVVSPIEGSYWEASNRHSYQFRLVGEP
jgi:general stress protein 26